MPTTRLVSGAIVFALAFTAIAAPAADKSCVPALQKASLPQIHDEVEALTVLTEVMPQMETSGQLQSQEWFQLLKYFALPGRRSKTPFLVTAIVGGGNSGKSTLFNALPSLINGDPRLNSNGFLSQTGWAAGITRQMVVLAPDADSGIRADLFQRFGALGRWTSQNDSVTPGNGVLVLRPRIPPNLAFIDSPDLDTGPVNRLSPDNLEAALKVICPSDALILIFHLQTYRNQPLIQRLAKVFRTYGNKKTVLIFLSDPAMPTRETSQFLTTVAEALYGGQEPAYRDGVLGTYWIAYNSEVAAGRQFPELVPLGKTVPFKDLIAEMNQNPFAIKEYSLQSAVKTISAEVSASIRRQLRSIMAMRLYAKTLDVLVDQSARFSLENFPFDNMRSRIREQYQNVSSEVDVAIQRAGDIVATPESGLLVLISQLAGRRADPEIRRGLEQDHRWHDRVAITQFIAELRGGSVQLNPTNAKEADLLRDIHRFARLYPEFAAQSRIAPSGVVRENLPDPSMLPPRVRAALNKLLNADSDELRARLGRAVNEAQFAQLTGAQIGETLRSILGRRPQGRRVGTRALQALTLAVPIGTLVGLYEYGSVNFWVSLLLANLSARPFHYMSNVNLNAYLKQRLNEWFHSLQKRVTVDFLNSTVTADLKAELTRPDPDLVMAIERAQQALKVLNPGYKGLQESSSGVL